MDVCGLPFNAIMVGMPAEPQSQRLSGGCVAKLQSAQVFLFVKTNSAVNSLVLIPHFNVIYTSLRFLKYLKDLKGS